MSVLTPDINTNVAPTQEEKKEVPIVNQQIDKQPNAETSPTAEKTEENEDPNWRAFREARKKDRAEREAAERRATEKEAEATALKAAMEAAFSKGATQSQSNQYGGYQSTDESEEEKIAKKVEEILSKREEQQRYEAAQREMQELPVRLQQNFPDFNNVCSQENLDYLDFHYPEIAGPLAQMKQGYDRWASIYQVIKKFIPNHGDAKKDAAKAEANMQKPRSLSSNSMTGTGEINRQSSQDIEARRAANYQRMQRIIKGV